MQVSARKQDWKGVGGDEKFGIFIKTLILTASFQAVLWMEEDYRVQCTEGGTIMEQPFQGLRGIPMRRIFVSEVSRLEVVLCIEQISVVVERNCCLKHWAERSQPISSLGKRVMLSLKKWDKLSMSNQAPRPQ